MGSASTKLHGRAAAAEFETLCRGYDSKTRARQITAPEALAKRAAGERIVFLDVREQRERLVSCIPRSIWVEWTMASMVFGVNLDSAIAALEAEPPGTTIVCACTAGLRSGWAANALAARLGDDSIVSLHGGIIAWANEGGEIVVPGTEEVTTRVHTYSKAWARFVNEESDAVY